MENGAAGEWSEGESSAPPSITLLEATLVHVASLITSAIYNKNVCHMVLILQKMLVEKVYKRSRMGHHFSAHEIRRKASR